LQSRIGVGQSAHELAAFSGLCPDHQSPIGVEMRLNKHNIDFSYCIFHP
jgi:hypothetical protein